MNRKQELTRYLKGNSDSISDIADDLEKETNELFNYHCGETSSMEHVKGFYGIVGLLRYISDYMREHSKEVANDKFFYEDREGLKKDNK